MEFLPRAGTSHCCYQRLFISSSSQRTQQLHFCCSAQPWALLTPQQRSGKIPVFFLLLGPRITAATPCKVGSQRELLLQPGGNLGWCLCVQWPHNVSSVRKTELYCTLQRQHHSRALQFVLLPFCAVSPLRSELEITKSSRIFLFLGMSY